ncbi:hypothetical protein [Robertkochia solimangrovi]|uniref:hypothetical protein n=1 Tax=Robertkochia solimangrovi TaxID=2213046 RepID=UPI00117CA775|nr:hypothetical protein [Robertkochia solimangrovi]TRZ44463.1 hypothetical protein DMZ48_08145 [Robertkochia solimangrovi]
MSRRKFVQVCENTMLRNLERDCLNNPIMGTALEKEMKLTSLKKSFECCRMILQELNDLEDYKIILSMEEIETIIKIAFENLKDSLIESY